ncbi:MAG: TlpA family protein disulfide reductase [Pseudomonadota bacterium]
MMKMKKPGFVALFLAAFFAFGTVAHAVERRAPAFELISLEGKKFTQENLTGKATLVVFWASSCGTCKKELPKISNLQKKMEKQGFQVLAVGFADAEADIRDYVTSHPDAFNFPVLYDNEDRVATRWGVRGTPTLFLVDKKGNVVITHLGGGLLETPAFHKKLDELLLVKN